MQGYLKFKENDEELYEINHNKKINDKYLIFYVVNFFIRIYFKLIICIKKWFHIITVKEIYSGLIFILPFSITENIERQDEVGKIKKNFKQYIQQRYYKKQLKKCIPKVKKLMKKYQVSTLVLSEKLRNSEEFLEEFQKDRKIEKQVHILNGKEIMPYLIQEIIEYILQKKGKTTALEDLYILVKKEDISYKENIAFLSQYFKTINIITPCLKGYQKLANQLEEKYHVMLTVTNNKKKSMRKAKWIVNFDMQTEEIKKYTIYKTATIIYLENSGLYETNTFDGIHICKAGIDVSEEFKEFFKKQYLINQCPITILYESSVIQNKNIQTIKKQMKKDKVKINTLYGTRGILAETEYKKVC